MDLSGISSILAYIQTILNLVKEGLRLNPEAFQLVYAYSGESVGIMFWIVFIAGASVLLGQSVTLFANRVSTGRFWLSIFLGGLKFFLDALMIVTVIWAIANLISPNSWEFIRIARAVALAYAPYWLGFLLFLPYFGILLERFLKVYVFLALVVALQAVFSINFFGALLAALTAVILSQTIWALLGRWLTPLVNRIDRKIFGDHQIKNSSEILQLFIERKQALEKSKED